MENCAYNFLNYYSSVGGNFFYHKVPLKISFFLFVLLHAGISMAQQTDELTVDEIMQDSKWMGIFPTDVQWSLDSERVFFKWDEDGDGEPSFYQVTSTNKEPEKISDAVKRDLRIDDISYTEDRSKVLFERNGDIFLEDVESGEETQITKTVDKESEPFFNGDETEIIFRRAEDLYAIEISGGTITQLTNFTRVEPDERTLGAQDQWLREDQLSQFQVLREREKEKERTNTIKEAQQEELPEEIYLDDQSSVDNVSVSPDTRFVVCRIKKRSKGNKNTIVPNYVTTSGYTENIPARTKVGAAPAVFESWIYDREKDRIYSISTENIPGIKDIPAYLEEYPEQLEERREKNEDREVIISVPLWNPEGSQAVVDIRAQNNKDRWIMKLDLENGELSLLERQHDEAWIGGPGIGRGFGRSELGWIDNDRIYFQSEESGYSHIYTLDVDDNSSKEQITSGEYEVQTLHLSNDKEKFYFTGNIEHPGITHFYEIEVSGGKPVQLTSMKGGNEVILSPDEEWLAIRHSYTTRPWELFLQKNSPEAEAERITESTSKEFESYQWKDPEMVSFENRHGTEIYAQVFTPEVADANKPAVVFIHSNGYLQNVHYRWSYHFREYMFNNLLVDRGYTVINIDYTASSGYGRDMRTGIYRHMGGKDLSDITDGTKWLIEHYDVNPDNIGMYGGSYGGFLTLMGLFTEPEVFKSGAALRSVTDWAHYNHGYTSNILNEPATDEKAYKRSSPIYFAEGFKGHLLMTHGIIDVNVQFQDIIRLVQRLIELGKEDWELAVYPLEDHDFVEPSSWTDQYHRVLELFEETLSNKQI